MKRFLGLLFMMAFLPYVTTLAWTGRLETDWVFEEETGGDGPFVAVERNGKEILVDAEEFLVGVLADQIPVSYGEETLKAQAVLARTYVYRELDGAEAIPEEALDIDCLSRGQMEELWGENGFAGGYQKLKEAIKATAGETLFYGTDRVQPFFCRAAAGTTRDGGDEYPYLRPVESPGDLEADGFLNQTMWTAVKLADRLSQIPDGKEVAAGELSESLQIAERDESGYVTLVQAGENLYTGEEVQYALGLPSACYSFENMDGEIRVACKGIGHGYGFSQAGANALEREGMTYRELLSYYFQNTEVRGASEAEDKEDELSGESGI